MTEVVVFGTGMKNNKKVNFVIKGVNQIIRAVDLSLPSIDSIVLDLETTKNIMC